MGDKLIDWLFGVLARPVQTLNEIAREKPVGWALLVALGVSILALAASVYGDEGFRALEEAMLDLDLFISPSFMVIGGLILVAASLFIFTGLLHLLARLFGGKGGYWNLFSAYCFAEFPMIIGVPVTLVSVYLGALGNILSGLVAFGLTIWVIVLHVIAVRESHGLSTGASIGVYAIHFIILIAVPVAVVIALLAALFVSV